MEPMEGNRALWDELVPIHQASAFYDVEGFRSGGSSLHPIEIRELGDVRDKSLLHLQCHFGLDTLSLARLGARATGADFSATAIEAARLLARETEVDAEFHCADIYALPDVIGSTFDIVYTSYGVICWLPDITRWAEVVSHFTKPGGVFYMVEFHPIIEGIGDGAVPELDGSYFYGAEPVEWRSKGTYALPGAAVSNRSYQWHHSLGDIVSALTSAGLVIEFLHEHADVHEQMRQWMVQDESGRWRAPHQALPVLFSIKAHKDPHVAR
jgi:SAM-dependent methyltransferase